jgi:hypothetical protein
LGVLSSIGVGVESFADMLLFMWKNAPASPQEERFKQIFEPVDYDRCKA